MNAIEVRFGFVLLNAAASADVMCLKSSVGAVDLRLSNQEYTVGCRTIQSSVFTVSGASEEVTERIL